MRKYGPGLLYDLGGDNESFAAFAIKGFDNSCILRDKQIPY